MDTSKLRNNIFFYPLLYFASLVYKLIIDIRNILYNVKIFKSISYSVPVISIGNITVGGTGKTPFTLFLVQKFITKYPNNNDETVLREPAAILDEMKKLDKESDVVLTSTKD